MSTESRRITFKTLAKHCLWNIVHPIECYWAFRDPSGKCCPKNCPIWKKLGKTKKHTWQSQIQVQEQE